MSTLQTLLSNIKVEQSGGAPMVPENTDGYVSLTPSGKNSAQSPAIAPHYGVPANLLVNDPAGGGILFLIPGNWAEPDNFGALLQELRDVSPLMIGKHLIHVQINDLPIMDNWNTQLVQDGSKVRVDYIDPNRSRPKPTTGEETKMVSRNAAAGLLTPEALYHYTKMISIMMGYVADNCYFDAAGKLQQHNTSGAQGYGFLPVGGVGNYVNHLPNNTQINGLPGAMALASFVPINLNPWMPMREGSVGQTGGAFVLSNAPSVAKYCADSNYLVSEVKKQLSLMKQKNMTLSAGSEQKVMNLLGKLQQAEASLCKTYTLLDAFIGSSEQGDGTPGSAPNAVMGSDAKGAHLADLEARRNKLGVEKRKLAVKALSTVLTLQDIVTNAVRNAMAPAVPPVVPPAVAPDAFGAPVAPIGMGAI
jgi:hypothetical protein